MLLEETSSPPVLPGTYLTVARAVPTIASRTAGDVPTASTSYVSLDTATDITFAGVTSADVIEFGVQALWNSENVVGRLDIGTIVSAAVVNYCSGLGSAGAGIVPWSGLANVFDKIGPTCHYTVAPGDLAAGSLTLRVLIKAGSAATKTMLANASTPFVWWARNLGH